MLPATTPTGADHPFDYVRQHDLGDCWALLYSGMASQGSGLRSLLAYDAAQSVTGGSFDALSEGQWFGYFSYEMLHELENIARHSPSPIALPQQQWFQPKQLFEWPGMSTPKNDYACPAVKALHSNMTRARYLDAVTQTIERIHAGDFYQANITRKFYGEFETAPDSFALFEQLCQVSPSPFSAYLQFGDAAILSSSPEGLLQIDDNSTVITRPIKGSAAPDDASLASSTKDRAENLMIVDLMRNDLAHSCEPSSIEVTNLYDVHRFATIQQMISTVTGTRRDDASAIDVIRGCFPPGSMTGAPKVAAMQWCAQQEQMERGIYSGALGWINSTNHTADLSVVIRTLILRGNHFEFQVGGGIVADSVPEKELEESILKARAIGAVLGIEMDHLREL